MKSDYDTVVLYDLEKLNEITESHSADRPTPKSPQPTVTKINVRLSDIDRKIMEEVDPELESLLSEC